jgi:hypothetical protein
MIGYKKNMQRENPLALLKRVLWFVFERIRILYHNEINDNYRLLILINKLIPFIISNSNYLV